MGRDSESASANLITSEDSREDLEAKVEGCARVSIGVPANKEVETRLSLILAEAETRRQPNLRSGIG